MREIKSSNKMWSTPNFMILSKFPLMKKSVLKSMFLIFLFFFFKYTKQIYWIWTANKAHWMLRCNSINNTFNSENTNITIVVIKLSKKLLLSSNRQSATSKKLSIRCLCCHNQSLNSYFTVMDAYILVNFILNNPNVPIPSPWERIFDIQVTLTISSM